MLHGINGIKGIPEKGKRNIEGICQGNYMGRATAGAIQGVVQNPVT